MVAPAQELINAMSSRHGLDIRPAVWGRARRSIEPVTGSQQGAGTPVAAETSFLI